jgi:putative FmdB family regulatory protein
MPFYEYICSQDGPFAANNSIARREHAPCPTCGQLSPKTISVPNVIYRGSGFYTKDKVLSEPENPLDTME